MTLFTLTWSTAIRQAAIAVLIAFCPTAPGSALQATPDRVQGLVFSVAANVLSGDARLSADLFIPRTVKAIRGVVVVLDQGDMGSRMFFGDARRLAEEASCAVMFVTIRNMSGPQPNRPPEAEAIRNAAAGSGQGFLLMMERLAQETAHPELKKAPMLFWGFSGGASFGTSFAALHPDRTIGFVRYHSHRRGVPPNLDHAARVPALLIAGAKDQVSGVEDATEMWKTGRAKGGLWALAVEPLAAHSSMDIYEATGRELMMPWMAAVLRQRLSGSDKLQELRATDGWLGDPSTGVIARHEAFVGDKRNAVWLPDESSAKGWQKVRQQ